ncbi:MAG: FkbM family methyltransferase [Bacteroidetes bacterium]|jgi:hypothetical protein|nr:FkbM family methyltransferase [Bacteroidota bacterium]
MFRSLYQFYSNVLLKGYLLPFYYRLLRGFFKLLGVFAKVSLSQFSEDTIIEIILKNAKRKNGVFVDVGCNHPIEYNNTYLLYLKGWRGINIDGNGSLIELYNKFRKEDINLHQLVSNKEEEVVFNLSYKDKISTIDLDHMSSLGEDKFPDHLKTKMITKTLNTILLEHYNNKKYIDLLCIDVENHDFEVLSSIDLDKYKPYLIVIEMLDFTIDKAQESKVYKLLTDNGYELKHFVLSNGFFIRND